MRNEYGVPGKPRGISIMRKVVGDKLQDTAKISCCYDTKGKIRKSADLTLSANKSKRDYDKNKNNVLDAEEWYDWRTDKVLIKDRMQRTAANYEARGSNTCPEGSFNCDETKKNEQCNK
jgi:hypothetical protein